jgi:sulfite oxidase
MRERVDWDRAPAIQETPVQSAITAIRHDPDSIFVEGYAFSGGGRRIIRVDVSVDNGQTWEQAQIEPHKQEGHKAWSWSLWNYRCPRSLAGNSVVVKAVDEAYNVQPETHGPTWNFRGNLVNAWHRVRIEDPQ